MIHIDHVAKRFTAARGRSVQAVADVHLQAPDGCITCLLYTSDAADE